MNEKEDILRLFCSYQSYNLKIENLGFLKKVWGLYEEEGGER